MEIESVNNNSYPVQSQSSSVEEVPLEKTASERVVEESSAPLPETNVDIIA